MVTSCKELTHWKRPWCWEGLRAGGEGDYRGWDGWMASPTRWAWVWVNSGSLWWTGRPGVLQFMGLQRVGHDWATELNWTELNIVGWDFIENHITDVLKFCFTADGLKIWFFFFRKLLSSWSTFKYGMVHKVPWRRKMQPTPVFLPGKFHGLRSLAGYSPWGCKESAMKEQLSAAHTSLRLCDGDLW